MTYSVCRRTFRDAKGTVPAGTVIIPADIKRYRYRLQEKHIVEVTEQNFKQYENFFKVRYGVTIPNLWAEIKPAADNTEPKDKPVADNTEPKDKPDDEPAADNTEPKDKPDTKPVAENKTKPAVKSISKK